MSFVRLKRVSGANYAYLVENVWTTKGSRQKTTKYLGKVVEIPAEQETSYDELPTEYSALIQALISKELEKRGFVNNGTTYTKDKITVDLNTGRFSNSSKPLVITSHEGFLSEHTYTALKNFTPKKKAFQKELATLLLAAGIHIEPALFVKVYEAAKSLS